MTLKDIARELNLSVNTISDVLNGGDQRYSAATRQRVHETAARPGYRPNRQTQLLLSLIGKKSPPIPSEGLLLSCTPHLRESCGVPPP